MTVANTFDVAGRLAEGRPAVDDVEEYVAACRRLGYQHPDLTAHPAQVRDWYSGEDGLDVRALESDHGTLSAAASVAEDAARMQADLAADLDAAWSGRGATAAREFLWRSCQSATAVSAALRAAADALATLRDSLWQAVDAKVLATEAVQSEQRTPWLAAAKTVTTGAGDVAAASELIDLQVTPFVDLEVGAEWLAAMREAASAVDVAYDAAIARITAPVVVFGVPGVLGPRGDRVALADPRPAPAAATGHVAAPAAGPTPVSVQTVPAAAVGSVPAPAPAAPWSSPEATTIPPPTAPVGAPPMSSAPAAGDVGAGTSPMGSMGSTGSGLGGFGQQLADLIGALVGSGGDLTDSAGVDEKLDEPNDLDEELDEPPGDEEDAKAEDDEEAAKAEDDEEGEVGEDSAVPEEDEGLGQPTEDVAAEPPPTPEPAPTTPPEPPAEPPPAVAAQPLAGDAGPTPCEIAADELPQVGE